ncbi:MAG: PA14 domain-containing protein, partial [Verrucomicrobia bacterium]|nr:PA14 domain-containing protein [Verrucomicrobiota bacterium]
QVVADSGNPPAYNAMAIWSTPGGYVQTRPTGVKFITLMATLVNNTGLHQNSLQIGYQFAQVQPVNERLNGHRVYYSLTGAANSWVNIPSLSSAIPGLLAANIDAPWPNGRTLYLLWADDNGSPSPNTANQIDNFYATVRAVPPYIISLKPLDSTVTPGDSASFTVNAGGSAPLAYQWRKVTSTATNDISNATNATYSIAGVTHDDAASYCVLVSNTFGSVTSAVATLTVIDAPHVVGLSVVDRSGLYVFFSTNMDAATALDISRYQINHDITVTDAEFVPALGTNGPQSVVRLDVEPLLGFFSDYSPVLTISNVLDAGNWLPITPNPTMLAFHLDYRALGYLYLSPLPGAEYVSAQTRFVLVRFKDVSPEAVANLSTFITVTGSSSGIHSGQTHIAMDGRTVIYEMTTDFTVNELVTVALTPEVEEAASLDSFQYQFVVAGHTPDLGTVTARGDTPPNEGKENAFDGDPATKWLDYIVPDGATNFSWIQYLYPNNAALVAGKYALTSAGDEPERDPADWNFYGVDASGSLVLLDRQTGQGFSSRYQTMTYTLTNFVAFRGYRLEITRVNDSSSATAVQLAELQFIERQGSLLREYWLNMPGTAVSDLTSNSNYPAQPSGDSQLSSFEAPSNWADNYGTRVRGYITAPTTGTYVFWISSHNTSELWLSPDDNPANKSLIASVPGATLAREWGKFSQQQSAGINLTAGQEYYVEALQKEGGVDTWYDYSTTLTTTGVAADNAVVWGTGPGGWKTQAEVDQSFVPVDFKYTAIPEPTETAYVTGVRLGPLRNDYSGWVGMQVVVGANPLTVTQLGRMMAPGNNETHTVKLLRASDGLDVSGGGVAISMSGGTVGQFQYGSLSSPVTLAAGTVYWVLSQETAGGDSWYDWDTQVTTTGVGVDNAVVWGTGPGAWNTIAVTNQAFVPVDFTRIERFWRNYHGASSRNRLVNTRESAL